MYCIFFGNSLIFLRETWSFVSDVRPTLKMETVCFFETSVNLRQIAACCRRRQCLNIFYIFFTSRTSKHTSTGRFCFMSLTITHFLSPFIVTVIGNEAFGLSEQQRQLQLWIQTKSTRWQERSIFFGRMCPRLLPWKWIRCSNLMNTLISQSVVAYKVMHSVHVIVWSTC